MLSPPPPGLTSKLGSGSSTALGPGDQEVGYFLLRVYRESLQRLPCELTSLSSYGAFVVVCMGSPSQRRCLLWVGSSCSPADRTMAEKLSLDVAVEDLGAPPPDCMVEDRENLGILDAILNTMWVQLEDYRRAARVRATTPICNKPSFLLSFTKDPVKVPAKYNLTPLQNKTPDPSSGKMAKYLFPAGADKTSILVVNVGDQYDLWFGESINAVEQAMVKAELRAYAVDKAPEKRRGIESVMFSRNLRVVSALDRSIFRSYFTDDSARRIVFATGAAAMAAAGSRHHRSRSGPDRHDLGSTSRNAEGCSDCVGDTILRLLGLTGDATGARLFWGPSSDAWGGRGGDPLEHLSPELEQAAIQNKIQRLTQKIEVKFLNPPRWGSKLLVLDLDHTLIDFSCRFEYMFEQLKRPHLDKFLAAAYRQQYDIAIWSQTNWKWLELKLTELGMLSRKEYKICFALDKSSMFTVRHNYIKPLQLIWNKFGDRWGPQNTVSRRCVRRGLRATTSLFLPSPCFLHSLTLSLPLPSAQIHVDDLSRNFELNKQNGLAVMPFYLNPADAAAAAAAAANGSSTMGLPPPPGRNPADDDELRVLSEYLSQVAKIDDMGTLDHSKWREKVRGR